MSLGHHKNLIISSVKSQESCYEMRTEVLLAPRAQVVCLTNFFFFLNPKNVKIIVKFIINYLRFNISINIIDLEE